MTAGLLTTQVGAVGDSLPLSPWNVPSPIVPEGRDVLLRPMKLYYD